MTQASDNIAEAARLQLDHLLAFSRYLIDLNKSLIARKAWQGSPKQLKGRRPFRMQFGHTFETGMIPYSMTAP